jgi:hypothetical protein
MIVLLPENDKNWRKEQENLEREGDGLEGKKMLLHFWVEILHSWRIGLDF